MRLNRYLAATTVLSRRGADSAIAGGRVAVNGQLATVGQVVADGDNVTLDGQTVAAVSAYKYLAVHKPVDVISSRRRQGNARIVYDLLPPEYHSLNLAGRLDRDSSGLILLSNDGDFIQAAQHPSADKEKIYEVELDRSPSAAHLAQLTDGVQLEDGPSQMRVVQVSGPAIIVALEEGRNRQIRRTLGHLGYGITRLHRTAIGTYELGDLPPGKWRELLP
jgi:23S rRNA pseudouridine2605 synthase